MNPRLSLARLYLPASLRRRKLAELLRLTARAFDAVPPPSEGLSLEDLRRLYAEFSRQAAERALSRPDTLAATEQSLFDGALDLGREIGRELRVSTPREVMAAARVLYGALGIDLEGHPEGDIVVRRCSFSGLYSPAVCRVMSFVDAGVLAGLAGGGRLEFTARLTEGALCCRARFSLPEGDR